MKNIPPPGHTLPDLDQPTLFNLDEVAGDLPALIEVTIPEPPPVVLTPRICERNYQGSRCDKPIPKGRRKYCSSHCAWLSRQSGTYSEEYRARKHRREIRMRRSDRAYARILKRPGSTFRLG